MRGKLFGSLGLGACAAAVCLLLGHWRVVVSEEAAGMAGLIFPRDRAVLLSGDLDVICKTADGPLEVEGETIDWEPFVPPVRVAHLNLYNGRNRIRIGNQQIEVFVARSKQDPAMPKGWKIFRGHPIEGQGSKRCADCHQIAPRGEQFQVGELKSYKACFECHKPVEFEAIHAHPLEPLEPCQSCHALTARPKSTC